MILVDFSAIAISTVLMDKSPVEENLVRHMILNTLRMYNKKFKSEYGHMILACDANSWRRSYFPEYKHRRKEGREESSIDWNEIFSIMDTVRDEIDEHMPYSVIKVPGAEADDIIGTLVFETQEFGKNEPVLILSGDKDFIQLQRFANVSQYSPMQKKYIKHDDPVRYLFEHIVKGDSSDGVPNILSDDNVFVERNRQSPISKKKLEQWYETRDNLEDVLPTTAYRNYARNRKLIDLSQTPDNVKREIINTYEQKVATKKTNEASSVLSYLVSKRCKRLIECAADFL